MSQYKLTQSAKRQTTISQPVSLKGFSPFYGRSCELTFTPAEANTGVVFRVKDREVPAHRQYLIQDEHAHTTTLQYKDVKVRTVEHVLSAIAGLGIDNLVIELPDGLIPAVSSTAEEYCRTLIHAGIIDLPAQKKIIQITDVKQYSEKTGDGYIVLKPSSQLKINATISFDNLIGEQKKDFTLSRTSYLNEIANCRSFMRSPISDDPDKWSRVRQKFPALPENPALSPIIVFNESNFITPLIKPNELVCHKILDLIGDLSLLGSPLQAEVEVYKPGHQFTHEVTQNILEELASV